ncbi:hypothetical protein HMPREF1624_03225 [Sporothrix schenckii ATCC 58251]|uniref:DNA polymerase theta subunit n=1 Tax=Sporothrix schenckii (strain ATCC 58251 / de Perez 2211183) TaxID=1391915 RepID=U7PZE8_SPOS1|nr:hypothetical protein HMPREF1624_03225 [Sporothrix schenckii ATCC 58251]
MAGNHYGVWHQTSEQAVRRQQTSSSGTTFATASATTTFAAGIKRRRDDEINSSHVSNSGTVNHPGFVAMPPPPPALRGPLKPPGQSPSTKKQPAVTSLPMMPSRLTAGTIVDAVDASTESPSAKPTRTPTPAPSWLLHGTTEYSQRRVLSATPSAAQDPMLSLSHACYGLPPQVVANLADMGIRSVYPWQKQCLLGGSDGGTAGRGELLDGTRSLVYAAPTGGGKSLVADVLMLRRVLTSVDGETTPPMSIGPLGRGPGRANRPKALLVLPFVALVQEKVRWLRRVVQGVSFQGDSLRVVGFFGGAKIRALWADFDIGVATIEKANALINTSIDDCTIGDLKVVVLDELHMVDDAHRGYLLELLATKLLCLEHSVQIVGMSATLNNIELLAQWLGAFSYQTKYRPVPIEEHLVYDGCIYSAEAALAQTADGNGSFSASQEIKTIKLPLTAPLRRILPAEHKSLHDPVTNAVVALANETARAGYGALVFASSRAASESDALLISRVLPATPEELGPDVWGARLDLLGELQAVMAGGGVDTNLGHTILAGVGFHHAGMTTEERDLVAHSYDMGVLKVIVATCGLAAGINLPARRVILHNARMGRELVGPAMLRQMRGRAGRKGKDELGETYLCCRSADVDDVVDLMQAELPHVSSCLAGDDTDADEPAHKKPKKDEPGPTHTKVNKRRLQRALLEVIAVRLATSRESLASYVRKTLLFHALISESAGCRESSSEDDPDLPASLEADVASSLAALQATGFVETDEFDNFQPSRLGKAVVASALDPADALFIHGELQRALQAFVLDGEMHVLYTFTPVHDAGSGGIDWRRFWTEMEGLDESGLRVLRFLGLKPSVISKMQHGGTLKETTAADKATARIYRRFYVALQLRDLCNEIPVHRVAQKYNTPRGAVQSLAQTCEGFAAGMIKFCEHMGWGAMSSVLEHFVDRLKAGAKADLLALARIAFVKSRTARVFWENGFKTVAAVANADPQDLLPVLLQAQASKARLGGDRDEAKFKEKLLEKAHIITESANRIWQLEMQRDLDEE